LLRTRSLTVIEEKFSGGVEDIQRGYSPERVEVWIIGENDVLTPGRI
jgi:hypothetical protein